MEVKLHDQTVLFQPLFLKLILNKSFEYFRVRLLYKIWQWMDWYDIWIVNFGLTWIGWVMMWTQKFFICDEYRVFKNFPRNRLIIGYCTDNTRTTYTWVKRFTNMHCSDIEAIDRDISFLRFWDKWIGNLYISLFFAKTFPPDQVGL